ncbi:MAG: cell division protein FtsA [Alphaproteobacteria bacterium]
MDRQSGHNVKRQRFITVLDVGTSKVCCMIAKAVPAPDYMAAAGQPVQLRVIGFGHQRSQGIKSGMIVHMDAAEQAIRAAVDQAERMSGVMIDEVILSISCGRLKSDAFSASVAIPAESVRTHDVDKVLRAGRDYAGRDGRMVLHTMATGYRLDDDNPITDPHGMIADRLSVDVHAVAADESPIRNLILCVERCHLSVADLVAAPYATGLSAVSDEEAKLGVSCIDMGAGTTSFSIFADGQFAYCDAIAMGGSHITLDLARSLSMPLDEAERIKTLHGCAFAAASDEGEIISFPVVGEHEPPQFNQASKAQIAQLVQARIEEILQLMHDRLESAGLGDMAGQHIVLTGGASQLAGLCDYTAKVFSKAVRLGRPRHLAGLPEHGVGPAFTTAGGLLEYVQRVPAEARPHSRRQYLGTGTGYFTRVSQWIRESF